MALASWSEKKRLKRWTKLPDPSSNTIWKGASPAIALVVSRKPIPIHEEDTPFPSPPTVIEAQVRWIGFFFVK